MSNTVLKENVRKKSQKGVALLFALGILGLLLVMALGFATNSIFDQLIASNSSNNSSARAIANSGLERVRLIIQNYSDTLPLFNSAALNFTDNGIFGYSHFPGDATVFTFGNAGYATAKSDMLSDNRFFGTYTTWSGDMTTNINWIYLKSDNQIIGRMAYIILNRADLDPGKLVTSPVDESVSPAAEERLGADPSEINLRTIDSGMTQAMALFFNYTTNATNPGKFNGNSWISLPFLFNQFSLSDATWQAKFNRWFICNSQNSPEAFWIDLNGDGKITSNEQFHRFNLARTDWNTAFNAKEKVYENILLDKNPVAPDGVPDQPPKLYTNSGTEDGYGIPWLALFGYKTDGTVDTTLGATFGNSAAGVIARRRQIAANLVDYCMPLATTATSDQSDWLLNTPTFTGNKKTPYINEIGAQVKSEAVITANGSQFDLSDTVTFRLYAELINIYDTTWASATLSLRVKGSLMYDYHVGKETGTKSFTIDTDINAFNWRNGYGTVVFPMTAFDTTISDLNVAAGQEHLTISNIRFYIDRAILYEPGTPNIFYDYSLINKTSTLSFPTYSPSPPAAGTDTQNGWFSVETEDPRQNLNELDWTIKAPAVDNTGAHLYAIWTADDTSGAVRGAVNTNSNPSGRTTDAETVTDPAFSAGHLSTAYIREAAMVSPWELGFIHRGEKWQTLNLNKYDATKTALAAAITVNGNKYWAGGGAYVSGDANILDQIKMNSSTSNYKIDLNNEYNDPALSRRIVLYSLFKNIKSGSTMLNTVAAPFTSGGTALSNTDIGNIVDSIFNRTGTAVNAYQTRAQVVNDIIAGSSPVPGYTTKAMKDEIMGKMINLVDFDSYYTVILVVQTNKDVGGPVGTPITINKKLSGDTTPVAITAELGKFDLKVDNGKNYYADEITSTLKVQALVHKKIDGTCEILSIKYIQ